jgi:hypothetical protein
VVARIEMPSAATSTASAFYARAMVPILIGTCLSTENTSHRPAASHQQNRKTSLPKHSFILSSLRTDGDRRLVSFPVSG